MIWTRLNEFEMFNEFKMMKITLKTVLIIVLRACKTVSIKPCINREDKSTISPISYVAIFVTSTVKFLVVVTPPYI